ncbi:MAG: NAD(P)/FAD-dependent oxidoreductase [Anaerolineaceae bacterium]|nr:NAD(P)/FAD-dependent oxidoreductase [Anaerolineaceae bacterium]
MKKYTYIIVGGGMTAAAAVDGIRSIDQEGSIAIFTDEQHPPYKRPPLSKGLWLGRPVEKVWFKLGRHNAVDVFIGQRIEKLDVAHKTVTDFAGKSYHYEKLLLATGGSPKKLPVGTTHPHVIYYRGFADYEMLQSLSGPSKLIGIVGGGFIGSEIAAVLNKTGTDVVMIFPEEGIGANVYPKDLTSFLTQYFISKGVKVVTGDMVKDIQVDNDQLSLITERGQWNSLDAIVVGAGIKPNTDLAEKANLKVDNGIVVDEFLQTSAPDIYAAGDVANFWYGRLGERKRVEHEDNALTMGKIAGQNMAGEKIAYTHLPAFYSDIFDLGYEAVGELSSSLSTESFWKDQYKEGVIFYHNGQSIRGVLLWNMRNKLDPAREMIGKPVDNIPVYQQELLAGQA